MWPPRCAWGKHCLCEVALQRSWLVMHDTQGAPAAAAWDRKGKEEATHYQGPHDSIETIATPEPQRRPADDCRCRRTGRRRGDHCFASAAQSRARVRVVAA